MSWPHLAEDAVLGRGSGSTWLFRRSTGQLASVSPVGHLVIENRDLFTDQEDAARALAEVFDAPINQIRRDLKRLEAALNTINREAEWAPGLVQYPGTPTGDRVNLESSATELDQTTHTRTIAALSCPIRITYPRYARNLFDDVLSSFEQTAVDPSHKVEVYRTGEDSFSIDVEGNIVSEGEPFVAIISRLMSVITMLSTTCSEAADPLFHAGAVGWNGAGSMILGASNQGKSSTTLELLHAGSSYLTDEVVAVEPATGRISGLARPIGLEGAAQEFFPTCRPNWWNEDSNYPRWTVTPSRLAPVVSSQELHYIFVLSFDGSSPTVAESIAPGDRLEILMRYLFNPQVIDSRTLNGLAALVEQTPMIRIRHAGARAAATEIASQAMSPK